ncbi:peptidyl-glycine alpha-amidating monooxygenase B-like isoform X2 [Littorina saxatilis]|uniref:Peptidylglycine monooxygenase n=1 Tax=Littorina saxatilis TaxID=31220 RepID=A0AAN9C2X1_9CAEN
MRGLLHLASLFYCLATTLAAVVDTGVSASSATSHSHMDILMKGAKPLQPDAYLCTSYEVNEEELYVVKFEALANADTAHHILMYGCQDGPYSKDDIWGCPPICRGGPQQIMFAWAKNAPPTQLPDGVGFRIGRRTTIKTIVMQIHYAKSFSVDESPDNSGIRLHTTTERQPNVAGIFLMMSYSFAVPPNSPKYHVDMSCQYNKQNSMYPFAYRTHSHGLGSVITGYQYNRTGYHMIGKGNPQWPQAFYPSNASIEVKPGDKLVARCTYNSTGMNHIVHVGATGNDEMCNFYIMFYTDASVQNPAGECGGVQLQNLVDNMPADSDVTLPPNPLLDERAHGHGHHHHSSMTHTQYVAAGSPTAPGSSAAPTVSAEPLEGKLVFTGAWPSNEIRIGQVGGVATDKEGNVYIFHRGERIWDASSFDFDNNFQLTNNPIMNDTVIIFSRDGKFIRQFGSGKYFMPHGIEVDDNGNIWLTDVALHQVFRIPRDGTEPDLTLGERFVHKEDAAHFCKPTDVAVLKSGEFYVSDGYCHSRILKFSKEGNLLKQWGRGNPYARPTGMEPSPGVFAIPHSVTVAEDLNLVCVADRENGRIQCFDLDGNFQYVIKYAEFGPRLFALEFCPRHGGLLFAVNGPSYDAMKTATVQGFTISLGTRTPQLLEIWNVPHQGLQNPHDVAVDVAGHSVYVGELSPTAVWKFQREGGSPAITTTTATTKTVTTAKKSTVTQIADKKDNIAPSGGEQGNNDVEKDDTRKEALANELSKDGIVVEEEEETSDFTPSIIIGVLLVIPVVLLLVITLVMRVHHKGWNTCFSGMRTPKVFNMQSFLGNSHKGFDKLSQEDSDHDADVLSDSDNEEFKKPIKSKA